MARLEAAIGLGANLGDRRVALQGALTELGKAAELLAVSPLYETAPIGGPEQGAYLNAVVILSAVLGPRALLGLLLDLEAKAGRTRRERWEARTLDLDLLLYGSAQIDQPGLVVPHPHITKRRFVLEPLLAIRPDATLPDGAPLAPYLAEVTDQEVKLIAGDWRPVTGDR